MYPPAPAFPASRSARPAGMPPIRRALRRLAWTVGGTVAAIGALVGGIYLHGRLTPQHTILIENGNAFAVDVDVGDTRVHLAPHSAGSARAFDGAVAVAAHGPGLAETHTLELPATGWRAGGRTAIYNVAGASELAIVTITYGTVPGQAPTPVELLPRAPRIALLPPGVAGELDAPFPTSIKTKRWGEIMRHVCHADRAAHRLGCPGAGD